MWLVATPTGAREMRPPEPGNKCPFSLMQCYPGLYPQNPTQLQMVKEEFLQLPVTEQQNMREQGGVSLTGNVRPQLEKTGHVLLCHTRVWSLPTPGSPILDTLQEPAPSIFQLALPGRGPCLHGPRWQLQPITPLSLAVRGSEKKIT